MKKLVAFLLCLVLWAEPCFAAISFDNGVGGKDNTGTQSSYTQSMAVASGATALFVCVGGGTLNDSTGVTYNGVSMTKLSTTVTVSGYIQFFYYLANPASGTHNVVASFSSNQHIVFGAASYLGSSTSGQPEAQASNTGSGSVTTSIITLTNNAWTIGCGLNLDCSISSNAPTTQRTNDTWCSGSTGLTGIFDRGPIVTAGSTSQTLNSGFTNVGEILVSLAPAGAGGSPNSFMQGFP